MDTIKIDKKETLMIAHRGVSGLELENTMASFIAAGNRSYYGIECDIHKTSDGVYVIIHDDNTARVSPVNKEIKTTTYEDLLALPMNDFINKEVNNTYLKIPTLREYVLNAKKYQKECVIEFKNQFAEEDVYEVITIINNMGYLDHCIFISFYYQNLLFVRRKYPEIRLQFLTSEYTPVILSGCKEFHVDIDINFHTLTKAIVDELHANNIKINTWTVDNPVIAETLIDWGVDFITTNILE
jgi:glycerophosphoryl diester phosphodiesterase